MFYSLVFYLQIPFTHTFHLLRKTRKNRVKVAYFTVVIKKITFQLFSPEGKVKYLYCKIIGQIDEMLATLTFFSGYTRKNSKFLVVQGRLRLIYFFMTQQYHKYFKTK